MKRFKTLKIGLLVATIIISISINGIDKSKAVLPIEFYEGETFSWDITSISNKTNQWYNISTFGFIGNWYANNSDELNFTSIGYVTINNENYLTGDVKIGNLSVTTHNQDIGFNLALSANPWYGGLVSLENDWNQLISEEPFNTTSADIEYDKTLTILGKQVNAIEIQYDDGFQQSTLYYEPSIGVLLKCNTISGFFNLSLLLSSSSIPLPETTLGLPLNGGLCILGTFICLVGIRKKKK